MDDADLKTSANYIAQLVLLFHVLVYAHIALAECNYLSELAKVLNTLLFMSGVSGFVVKWIQVCNDVGRHDTSQKQHTPPNRGIVSLHALLFFGGVINLGLFVWMWVEQGVDSKPFVVTQTLFAVFALLQLSVEAKLEYLRVKAELDKRNT